MYDDGQLKDLRTSPSFAIPFPFPLVREERHTRAKHIVSMSLYVFHHRIETVLREVGAKRAEAKSELPALDG